MLDRHPPTGVHTLGLRVGAPVLRCGAVRVAMIMGSGVTLGATLGVMIGVGVGAGVEVGAGVAVGVAAGLTVGVADARGAGRAIAVSPGARSPSADPG